MDRFTRRATTNKPVFVVLFFFVDVSRGAEEERFPKARHQMTAGNAAFHSDSPRLQQWKLSHMSSPKSQI